MKAGTITILLSLIISIVISIPKPSPRIERIAVQLENSFEKYVISSSIFDHNSNCIKGKTLREKLLPNFSGIADGGLTIEEAYFLSQRLELRRDQTVTLLGLYALNQPFSYQIGNHFFYTGMINGNIRSKPNWRERDPLVFEGDELLPLEFNTKKDKIIGSSCNWSDQFRQVLDSIYNHIYYFNNKLHLKNVEQNIRLLKKFSKSNYIILPPMELLNYKQNKEISTILELLKKHNLRIIELETEDYDEPWCLCGHLSDTGIDKVVGFLNAY